MSTNPMHSSWASSNNNLPSTPQHGSHNSCHCRRHSGPFSQTFDNLADKSTPLQRSFTSTAGLFRLGAGRAKSDSYVAHHEFDDALLIDSVVTKPLGGGMTEPSQYGLSGDHRSIHLRNGSSRGFPSTTPHMSAMFNVAVPNKSNQSRRSTSSSCDLRPRPVDCGIDGHRSLPSDDSDRRVKKARSALMTPPTTHSPIGSAELDRRLRAIDDVLLQDSHRIDRRGGLRRLYVSELSRKEHSQAVEDGAVADLSCENASDALFAWRNDQLKELSQQSGVLFPSLATSETQSSSEPPLEVCTAPQGSYL